MPRRTKATAKVDPSTPPADAAQAPALSVQDKIKLLVSDSLAAYPSGLSQPFSRQELARLKKRFAAMLPADSVSLLLPVREFLLMPELRLYPFVPLVTDLVVRRNGDAQGANATSKPKDLSVNYQQFLTILGILSGTQSLESKKKVFFDVFDADADGFVVLSDFVSVLSTILSKSPVTVRARVEARLQPVFTSTASSNQLLRLDVNAFYQLIGTVNVPVDVKLQLISDDEVWNAVTIPF